MVVWTDELGICFSLSKCSFTVAKVNDRSSKCFWCFFAASPLNACNLFVHFLIKYNEHSIPPSFLVWWQCNWYGIIRLCGCHGSVTSSFREWHTLFLEFTITRVSKLAASSDLLDYIFKKKKKKKSQPYNKHKQTKLVSVSHLWVEAMLGVIKVAVNCHICRDITTTNDRKSTTAFSRLSQRV